MQIIKCRASSVQLNKKTENLLLALAKGVPFLKLTQLRDAVKFLFPQKEHIELNTGLIKILRGLQDQIYGQPRFPVILILDEVFVFIFRAIK